MLHQDKINNLIPRAMQVIEEVEYQEKNKEGKIEVFKILEPRNGGIVKNVYESYIASFGANLSQSGLMPTLVFYQKTKGDGKRILWSKAIYKMLLIEDNSGKKPSKVDNSDNALIKYVVKKCSSLKNDDIYQLKDLDTNKLDILEQRIARIAVALKMAVRTFKIEK